MHEYCNNRNSNRKLSGEFNKYLPGSSQYISCTNPDSYSVSCSSYVCFTSQKAENTISLQKPNRFSIKKPSLC
ncbi:uncharacterized protein LOC143048352 isoform X2 [Mytilus galloprovincialis]|uniref:uncharacterized protein LOC143048352 isoform X2 n=1 Tax=Mytilus galloprovincialis TaxID=29158 RepID=UPI003F7BAAB8